MKKVTAIVAALGVLGAAQAFAQAKNFEGWSVGANLEVDHGSLSASEGSSDSANNTGLGLQARYDWALGEQYLLGLGLTAGPGHRSAGNYLVSTTGAETKNRYSIDVMPGYAINNKLMVYGKLSALSATALSDDGVSTATVHGTGYGIGLRGLIDHHTYWQAGLDAHRYSDVTFGTTTTATFKDTVLSVGVGYKF